VPTGVTTPLRASWFGDVCEGWVVGDGGVVLHTRDGGWSYSRVSVPTKADLKDVTFESDGTGWIVGSGGVCLRSTDAGATWKTVPTPTGEALGGVTFDNGSAGWIVGGGGAILKAVSK
jgi:photosystem II stability/assembly factor-like uncharacterized protein